MARVIALKVEPISKTPPVRRFEILVLLRVAGIIGVVIGQRCGGDDFAGVDVEDGGGGGLGAEAVDRVDQFVAQGMGGAHIDRQRHRPQVLLRHGYAGGAQGAEPLVVQILLDALQAVVVRIGEADDVGAQPSVGIDALVLRQEADAGQAETENLVLLRRRDLALDPDKSLLLAQFFAQFAGVEVGQDGGELFDRLVLVDDGARLREHRHHLDVGGHHLAVAVGEIGPRRGHGLRGLAPGRLLAGRYAEPGQTAGEHAKQRREQQGDETDAATALFEVGRKQRAPE